MLANIREFNMCMIIAFLINMNDDKMTLNNLYEVFPLEVIVLITCVAVLITSLISLSVIDQEKWTLSFFYEKYREIFPLVLPILILWFMVNSFTTMFMWEFLICSIFVFAIYRALSLFIR